MVRRCRMCERPVRVPFATWLMKDVVFCPPQDVSSCIATWIVKNDVAPDDDEEPPFPDPLADEPPEDMDVCPRCKGLGEVITRQDWATGAYEVETCVCFNGVVVSGCFA